MNDFTYKQFATFDECDPAGILFFGHYFNAAHRTIERWVEHCGIGWKNWFAHPVHGVPLRHVEAEYLHPINCGDSFEGHVEVIHVGDSSVALQVTFKVAGQVAARIKTNHVFVDLRARKKIPIPADIREHLVRLCDNNSPKV